MWLPIIYFSSAALAIGCAFSKKFRMAVTIAIAGSAAFALYFLLGWGLL